MSYRKKHINPKIKRLKPKQPFFKKPLFWVIFVIIIVAVTLYFLLFFPKLQVENINVSGNDKVQTADILAFVKQNYNTKLFGFMGVNMLSRSIFMLNTDKLSNNILVNFPDIAEANIQKQFPQTINLNIKERTPFGVFCSSDDKCFLIDNNGVIFENLNNVPDSYLLLQNEPSAQDFTDGQSVVDRNIIEIISKVQKSLEDNFQIDTKKVFLSNPIIFKTSENWQIYFDPNSDIDLQISKMDSLLKNDISPQDRKTLQYIYLQYKDKAYYK